MSQDLPHISEFEALFVNNTSLNAIRSHLARFNPIKTMGMQHMEIRHSSILGWLLDPQQTHGLGDRFLRSFLSEALRGTETEAGPTALQVAQADLMDAEVRREWRHIDLLVITPANGWVFVIENKFHSGQHGNQLKRYIDIVEDVLLDGETLTQARGVFLSLLDEEPKDERFVPIQYADVCGLIAQCAFASGQTLAPEIEAFIKHYLEVIEEATGMNQAEKDMQKLARQLYRDNKRVLDFVISQGATTDFDMACESVLGTDDPEYMTEFELGGQTLVFSNADNVNISFLPKSWFDAFAGEEHWWHGVENWWAGFPVIMWLSLQPHADNVGGQIRLYAEVGPLTDHGFRKALIEAIASLTEEKSGLRIGFQRGATTEGKRYSKFLKKSVLDVDDIHDHEKIATAMTKLIKGYRKEIIAVAEVLPQFLAHGQKEAS